MNGLLQLLADISRYDTCYDTTTKYLLQKQVGCFNHRMVTLVADKLERQWLLKVCFGIED